MKDRILVLFLSAILFLSAPAAAVFADELTPSRDDFIISESDKSVSESNGNDIEILPDDQAVIIEDDQIIINDEDNFETNEPALAIADYEPAPGEASPTWGAELLNLPGAKADTMSAIRYGIIESGEIVVAVIDTGIYADHELFTDTIPQDRIHPASRSFINEDPSDYRDLNGHGTHVAGIIADNTPADVKLMILQALDSDNSGTADDLVRAINYAVANGADIINLSLSISKTSASEEVYEDYLGRIEIAIKAAANEGIPIIASAGNEGKNIATVGAYPANSDMVITVNAIAPSEENPAKYVRYSKSNYGSAVDFCAPGSDICSAGIDGPQSYVYLSGTSVAVPFITSAYALTMLSDEFMTAEKVKNYLVSQTVKPGVEKHFGKGYPELYFLYRYVDNRPERPEIRAYHVGTEGKNDILLTWDAFRGVTYNVYGKYASENSYRLLDSTTSGEYLLEDVSEQIMVYIDAIPTDRYSVSSTSWIWDSWNPGYYMYPKKPKDDQIWDNCGDNLTWKVSGTYGSKEGLTLTISGNGLMDDYTPKWTPWIDSRDEIKKIVIEEGVQYIGDYAFYLMNNVESIRLSSTITGYGTGAFAGIENVDHFIFNRGGEDLQLRLEYYAAVYQEVDGHAYPYYPVTMVQKETGEKLSENIDYIVRYENTANTGNGSVIVTFPESEVTVNIPFTVYENSIEGQAGGLGAGRMIARLSGNRFDYNGSAHTPRLTVRSTASSRNLTQGIDYYVTGQKSGINAGTYRMTVIGKGGFSTYRKDLSFTISPKRLTGASVAVSGTVSKPYTGAAVKPSVIVKQGGRTISNANYTVAYKNNVRIGRATIVVTGKKNYTGTVTGSFTISRASMSKSSVSGIASRVTYTGKAITPKPTVKVSGKTLKSGTDYTLSYKNNKNTGTARVVITGKGNYSGTKTISFSIVPKEVKITSLTRTKNQLNIKWTKSAQSSGYEIQYSTGKGFSNAKTQLVSASSLTSASIPGLTSGKTWYIRIRAYKTSGGNKMYSIWSPFNSIK